MDHSHADAFNHPKFLLFTPGRIGAVEIRNRVVMPPMTTRLADAQGFVTDEVIAYFRERAAGGVGLVTVEMASPEPAGRHRAFELGISDDRFIPGLRNLVHELHQCGARVSIQLGHAGGHTRKDISGFDPVAPSAVPHFVYEVTGETVIPQEMTHDRIRQVITSYVAAGRRAQEAGFDFIEIHAAHGYLISQFLCPAENKRDDQYGGSLENRARFGMEVLQAIKRELPELPLIFRIGVEDFFPEGMPAQEGIQVAQWAAQAGADAIHVSAGHYRSLPSAEMMIPPMRLPFGTFLSYARAVKALVDVPVIAVGRLGDPDVAENALASGAADFVAIGRQLLADPDWCNKVKAGIGFRRCLACNTCVNEMRGGARIHCLVNPSAGRELKYPKVAPQEGRRVAVIGAGPAGLSYALLMAPHNKVAVFEKERVAGGAFRYAGKAPMFQEVVAAAQSFELYIADMEKACREAGVEFHYQCDVTGTKDLLASYDHVVVATGARYPFGATALIQWLLGSNSAMQLMGRYLFKSERVRNWFYYRLRRPTGLALASVIRRQYAGKAVSVIGDALAPGKSEAAILSAYELALHK